MPVSKEYGKLSWRETLTFPFLLLKFPLGIALALLSSPFIAEKKLKSWRRVVADYIFRWGATNLSVAQIQKLLGTTESIYRRFMYWRGLQPVEEDIGDGGKLLWIGPKRTDRVLLYFHGGGFHLPISEPAIQCWRYVQKKLRSPTNGAEVGVAILRYSLIHEGRFPVPLRQAVLAIEHLLASGVHPSKLQLTGDSAGGNLVAQILLHALRPVDGVPPLQLAAPIRGAYMISPWVSLAGNTGSHLENSRKDMVSAELLGTWGREVLYGVPASQRGYVEANQAPEAWFEGMNGVVERILITAGADECLRDDIVQFGEMLKGYHSKVDLVVQRGGIHNDMFLDFAARLPEGKLGELTPMFIQWFAEGYGDTKIN